MPLMPYQKDLLQDNISHNLEELIKALGVNRKKFASMTGVVDSTLCNYLKSSQDHEPRLPPIDYLMGIVMMEEFRNMGLELSLDLLISEKFDPQSVVAKKNQQLSASRQEEEHGDIWGNYICYYFDQSTSGALSGYRSDRKLRYGVISVYHDTEALTGESTTRAYAAFFEEKEEVQAISLKEKLDAVTRCKESHNGLSYIRAIDQAFSEAGVDAYEGIVTFTNGHTFINFHSGVFKDNALIILYSPQKKTGSDYIGGLGCVASVTRGRSHLPAFQKILVSKYLITEPEEIADHLYMSDIRIDYTQETQEFCEFCSALYSDPTTLSLFNKEDKIALLRRRMEHLIRLYLKKNVCCVGVVSVEEDSAVYRLIAAYKDLSANDEEMNE